MIEELGTLIKYYEGCLSQSKYKYKLSCTKYEENRMPKFYAEKKRLQKQIQRYTDTIRYLKMCKEVIFEG